MNFKIIGLGGIGCYLVDPLVRYLYHKYKDQGLSITLIDGDVYEEHNSSRQPYFNLKVNKAVAASNELAKRFSGLTFKVKKEYITKSNVSLLIREKDTVFLCVDNHQTRKIVSDRCEELDNITLISGGNEYIDGNVMYYNRVDGKDITLPLTKLYDSIANPKDENPGDKLSEGCEAQTKSEPQLVFTNFAIASAMGGVYYAHDQGKAKFHQVYVDILTQRSRPAPEIDFDFGITEEG